jgi:hypothetical protein
VVSLTTRAVLRAIDVPTLITFEGAYPCAPRALRTAAAQRDRRQRVGTSPPSDVDNDEIIVGRKKASGF